MMMCEGGHFSLFPTIMVKLFGREMGTKVYGLFFFNFGFASMLAFVVQLYVVANLGYLAMMWILTGLTIVSILIN
jgi:hypothetical protein